jgi:hypothetical protein
MPIESVLILLGQTFNMDCPDAARDLEKNTHKSIVQARFSLGTSRLFFQILLELGPGFSVSSSRVAGHL